MRRIVYLLAGVLLVVPSLGSDAPKGYDGDAERDVVEGTWRLVAVESDGLRDDDPQSEVRTFRRGTYAAEYPDEILRGNYRTDPARTPPHLDVFPARGPYRGQAMECLYRVEGDTLRVAEYGGSLHRPRSFVDAGLLIRTYRRVK